MGTRELNSRIPPQHSVFLFGGDRTIEPDRQCIILAEDKPAILDSIEGFSQTTETTLFPDFDGFVYQRTQYRPYVPEGYESYRAAGYRASGRGDYKEAISCFNDAIRLDSKEAEVHYWRGESKYYLNQFADAIPDFNKAIDLKDDDLKYYRLRGYARFALNQFNKAKDDIEKALEIAKQDKHSPLMNSIIASIESKLHQIDLQLTQGDQWTPERFKGLVPQDIRDYYDDPVSDEKLYKLGAELQSLIQHEQWKLLKPRFGRSYFVFRYGNQPTFGVNLFGNPRLAIWGTEADASKFSELEHKPTYYPRHKQWLFPREATVEELRDIFESIYNDVQNQMQMIFPNDQSEE